MNKLVKFAKEIHVNGEYYIAIVKSFIDERIEVENITVELRDDATAHYFYETKTSNSDSDKYVRAIRDAVMEWKQRQFSEASRELDQWNGDVDKLIQDEADRRELIRVQKDEKIIPSKEMEYDVRDYAKVKHKETAPRTVNINVTCNNDEKSGDDLLKQIIKELGKFDTF